MTFVVVGTGESVEAGTPGLGFEAEGEGLSVGNFEGLSVTIFEEEEFGRDAVLSLGIWEDW